MAGSVGVTMGMVECLCFIEVEDNSHFCYCWYERDRIKACMRGSIYFTIQYPVCVLISSISLMAISCTVLLYREQGCVVSTDLHCFADRLQILGCC